MSTWNSLAFALGVLHQPHKCSSFIGCSNSINCSNLATRATPATQATSTPATQATSTPASQATSTPATQATSSAAILAHLAAPAQWTGCRLFLGSALCASMTTWRSSGAGSFEALRMPSADTGSTRLCAAAALMLSSPRIRSGLHALLKSGWSGSSRWGCFTV